MRSTKPRRLLFGCFWSLVAVLAVTLALGRAIDLVPDPLHGARPTYVPSVRVEDRQGRLLREFLSSRDTWSRWTGLDEMSPHLVHAALAAEDKRFFLHPGVDPVALARALIQNLRSGRIVSGASTITMQLARLLDPGPRTWKRKSLETLRALRIERSHSKDRIMEQYLNRAPCGNLAYGVPAGAHMYFGKTPAELSPAEAAFIMALPQAPTTYNPFKYPERTIARRNRILDRMAGLGYLSPDQAARAKAQSPNLKRAEARLRAPHFAFRVRALLPDVPPARVRTTLDLDLQTRVERLVALAVERGKGRGINQAAVLVMDHRTREVLAWVGSADFHDPREGQNDGVTARRQPGSAVKPFTYAAAFDRRLTPADLIDDSPVDFGLDRGVYSPVNYDRRFHGRVPARLALASSLNVPAVKVLADTGLVYVHDRMKAAGLASLDKEPDFYGLGLTLGCGEVSLLELANAYATLASGGVFKSPVLVRNKSPKAEGLRVFSEEAAYLVTHILSDDAARATGFGRDGLLALPFPAAAKTGTSKNFRDNWTVGYTSSIVVAVWAGNFDARPMGRVSGISGAGPLWRDVMRLAAEYDPPKPFTRPNGVIEIDVCPDTGLRAAPACPNRKREIFIKGRAPAAYCLEHGASRPARPGTRAAAGELTILNPRPGERYLFDPGIENGFQNISLEAAARPGLDWLIWYVNGHEAGRVRADGQSVPELLWPLTRGHLDIRLVGRAGDRDVASREVSIVVH